jgi:hypothetical protein
VRYPYPLCGLAIWLVDYCHDCRPGSISAIQYSRLAGCKISDDQVTNGKFQMLELIIINYNMYGLICNKYILYNGLSNYIYNEVIKFYIGFIICHEKWVI